MIRPSWIKNQIKMRNSTKMKVLKPLKQIMRKKINTEKQMHKQCIKAANKDNNISQLFQKQMASNLQENRVS